MDFLDELNIEKEKQRLLSTYNCKNLDEVIQVLKNIIKENNELKKPN